MTTSRVYYGWVIVSVLSLFASLSVAMAGPNLAIFIKPMQEELGWSASVFGWAQFARFATVMVAGPLIGGLLDRQGPRFLIAFAAAVTGGTVIALAFVTEEWHLIALFVLTGLVGMGRAVDLYVSPSVSKWFVERRGAAMSRALMGIPIGIIIFYPGSQLLIEAVGWRNAWLLFGAGGALILVPVSLWLLRRQPEDMGLLPDGRAAADTPLPGGGRGGVSRPEHSWTRAEALRNRTFWLMIGGFGVYTFAWSTLTIFRVPHYVERGMGPLLVTLAIATDAVVAVGVSLALGRFLDRFPARLMMVVSAAGLVLSAAAAIVVTNAAWMFVSTIGFGFGVQVGVIAQNVMWADYFGRRSQGAIRGVTLPLTMAFGAVAFPLTGFIRDATGVYTPAWFIAIAAIVAAAAALASIRPPTPRAPAQEEAARAAG